MRANLEVEGGGGGGGGGFCVLGCEVRKQPLTSKTELGSTHP